MIKENLPRKAKTLSSNSEKLLNEAKITQKKLQQGMGGKGGWDSQGLENDLWDLEKQPWEQMLFSNPNVHADDAL